MVRSLLPSQKPKPSAPAALSHRVSDRAAGYMELEGATKDADCEIVEVKNGISSERGCCNLYDPLKGADKFDCGHCEYGRKG
jgi:hypothetical protein